MTRQPWTPTLDDFAEIAAFVLGTTPTTIRRLPRIALAESALGAPFATFGGTSAYPELIEQAAVLLAHLAQNHPLPDGNKRSAFLLMARFLDANGRQWRAQDVERDATMVERVAAGAVEHRQVVDWIRSRLLPEG